MDPLHVYTLKIVELGQRTLALHRRGQGLPEELATLAAELLALDTELRPQSVVSPVEAWTTERDSAVPLASRPTSDDVLVLDVEEEAGGPALIYRPPDALPPLVIDVPPVTDFMPADPAGSGTGPLVMPADPAGDGHSAAESRACARCGATLRPGKRFCHRCGAPA